MAEAAEEVAEQATAVVESVTEEVAEAASAVTEQAENAVADATEEVAAVAAAVAGDAGAGEKVFRKCKACHAVEAGKNRVGPSLHGLIGRDIGSADGFSYSSALGDKGGVWSVEEIDAFLADPKGYAPGNKMTFAGLKKEKDRQNVIAYIESISN